MRISFWTRSAAVFVGVLFCCAALYWVFAPVKPATFEKIVVQYGPCFQGCPTYSFTITGDGKVDYEGGALVKNVGKASGVLTPEQLVDVGVALAKSGILTLPAFPKEKAALALDTNDDMPMATLSVIANGEFRLVSLAVGKYSDFSRNLAEVIGLEKWTGSPLEIHDLMSGKKRK